MKLEQEKEKLLKDKANILKARGNPSTDPGYDMKTSQYQDELCNVSLLLKTKHFTVAKYFSQYQ